MPVGNILLKYMIDRFGDNSKITGESGPVITISREYGCPSREIADKTIDILNSQAELSRKKICWRCVNRDIIENAARELHTHPEQISRFFNTEQKNVLDEMIHTLLESNYQNEMRIKKTLSDVISLLARQGYIIIVGRGGVALTQDFKKAFHIRLIAPLDWRLDRISAQMNISRDAARKTTVEADKKRMGMIDFFLGKKSDLGIFDLVINCRNFNIDQAANLIIAGLKQKMV